MTNIFDEIRAKTQIVAESATFVKIQIEQLDTYVDILPIKDIKNPPLDADCHLLGQGYDTLLYFLTLESINFGSGYFPHLENRDASSGYFTIAKAWKSYFEKNSPVTADALEQLTTVDCLEIFGQSPENTTIVELMEHFAVALNQVGHFLNKNFEGQVKKMFESVHHSAEKLVNLLLSIPYFRDTASYNQFIVPILKRAQITAADIALAFSNQGIGHFKDLDRLTIFADNMVPHVLRCDGILVYEEGLSNLIDSQQYIEAGSKPEIELRACAIHAVELLRQKFAAKDHKFSSVDLDYLLWNRGLHLPKDTPHALHLTKTIFY